MISIRARNIHTYWVRTVQYSGQIFFYENMLGIKVKVKCTLVQALRLCTGRTAHRGGKGIALPFLDHAIRRG